MYLHVVVVLDDAEEAGLARSLGLAFAVLAGCVSAFAAFADRHLDRVTLRKLLVQFGGFVDGHHRVGTGTLCSVLLGARKCFGACSHLDDTVNDHASLVTGIARQALA